MTELSQQTQKLLQQHKAWYDSLQKKEGVATIHVDEVASQVAAFYEKIRGVIDWREEHLLRRGAIERILKRKLFLRVGQKIEAQPFVLELIRGGHFPNDKIPESKIGTVQKVLDKYIFIIENSHPEGGKSRVRLQDWMSTIAACEVEEILDPSREERIMIEYMSDLMKEKIKLIDGLSDEEKNIQIYIAVHKALFKLDAPIVVYHLLKRRFPQWNLLLEESNKSVLDEVTKNVYSIWDDISKQLRHPLSEKFYRVCEKYDTPYLILSDILSNDPTRAYENLSNPEILETKIREFYQLRLRQQKSRVSRAAAYSTISIFITKMLLALLIEWPIDTKILHQFSWQAMGLNVAIPPLLMLILVLSITPPRKSNLEKVIMETMKVVYETEKKDVYPIHSAYIKNAIMEGTIFILYSATFFLTFCLIWWGLGKLDFSWPSRIIFVLFFSLIFFAGTKIKERAKELSIEEEKGGFLGFLIDWISLPFIRLGKWLSGQWNKYNTALVFVIALIDLPFQIFVELLEQWRYFIKEKKEEIH
ncbi:MAG: hypothetical protein V1756_02680 [Patescibacteria group bacterium]